MIKILSLLIITLVIPSNSQTEDLTSPCPKVLQYTLPEEDRDARYDGMIKFTANKLFARTKVEIALDEPAYLLLNDLGPSSSSNNKDFLIEINGNDIKDVNVLKFIVRYNPLKKVPKIESIKVNGKETCDVPEPPDFPEVKPAEPRPAVATTRYYPWATSPTSYRFEDQCGKVSQPVSLVTYGKPTYKGQWPWQVALFHLASSSSNYICGGALVSARHVITAAHCVVFDRVHGVISPKELVAHMGRHDLKLTDTVEDIQIRFISKITVHPHFKLLTFKRDIAILRLLEAALYTDYVRPVCLWSDNDIDLRNIVGRIGSVAGWGRDEYGTAGEELHLAEMPVVDQLTCARSNDGGFYLRYTSDYTYCAGFKNGTSVCKGDSGSGMYFKINDSWYLRGIVSLSLAVDKTECDIFNYVIFTDTAKLLPWIKQNMDP